MFRSTPEVGSENDPTVINSMQDRQRRAAKSRQKAQKEDKACGQQLLRWKALASSKSPSVLPQKSLKCKSSALDTQQEVERLQKTIKLLQCTLKEAELYAARLASTVITGNSGDNTWALLVPDLHRLLACLQSAIAKSLRSVAPTEQNECITSVSSCTQKEESSQLLRSLEKLREIWEPYLEILEQVGSWNIEEPPYRISSSYTCSVAAVAAAAAETVSFIQGPVLDVLEEEDPAELLNGSSRLSDTVSEVKMPDDDSFLGGGLILMDESPMLDRKREDKRSNSTKLSEVAPATTKGESECLIVNVMRDQQHSLVSTDQCQVDLDPVVIIDKDLFYGDTRREEGTPPLGASSMAVSTIPSVKNDKRKRRAEGPKKSTTGLQSNRRRSLRINKWNSGRVVFGETGGGSIFIGENEKRVTEERLDCHSMKSNGSHSSRPLEKQQQHNIDSCNTMHQLALESAQRETQPMLHESPSQGAVVVSTSSPVIVAKAQAHDISKCAEEQLPPCSTLLPRFESIEEKKPMSCEAQIGPSPLKPLASDSVDWLRATDIVSRISEKVGTNRRGINVTPGSVVLCAAQLLSEREVGPIAFNTATGNAVCEWLRPLCEALVAAECAAEAQLTDSFEDGTRPLSRPRSVRFSTFAFSSVDMPHDFCPESVQNVEHAIGVLKAAWKASSSLRNYLQYGNTVAGLDAFLRALKTLHCSASTALANVVRGASTSMGVMLLSDAQVTQAAAFYLDEFCSLAAQAVPAVGGDRTGTGRRNPLILSPVRLRLTNLIGTTLRFHLRRLLNPPPAGWKGETGTQLMTERIKQANSSNMVNVPPSRRTRRIRSRVYQLVEMVEPNVDKEFSCLRVAGKSVKASSMAVSIADGSISSVLSKALHVLSQYRRTDGVSRLECCENFITLNKCHNGKAAPIPMQEVAEHFIHMADLCAAAAARTFVLDLLLFPGFTAAIQEEGGWGPVETLAKELDEVAIQEVDCYAHLVLLGDIDSLQEYLINEEVWKYYDRATTAMNNLEPWLRRLGGARADISSRNACSAAAEACCGMVFPTLRPTRLKPQSSMEETMYCTRAVIQDSIISSSFVDSYSCEARK